MGDESYAMIIGVGILSGGELCFARARGGSRRLGGIFIFACVKVCLCFRVPSSLLGFSTGRKYNICVIVRKEEFEPTEVSSWGASYDRGLRFYSVEVFFELGDVSVHACMRRLAIGISCTRVLNKKKKKNEKITCVRHLSGMMPLVVIALVRENKDILEFPEVEVELEVEVESS